MLNRRKIVLIVGLILLPTLFATAFAAERTIEAAAEIAADFFGVHNSASRKRALKKESVMNLIHQRMKTDEQNAAFYVFNREKEGGFVVVSADDRANAILCYSEEGSFDADKLNPSFAWWLDRYAQQISSLNDISENLVKKLTNNVAPISPLLGNMAWNQATPYNLCCPVDQWRGKRSLTGCVATGTAQIMRYWKYPANGVGQHSYDWYDCDDISCTRCADPKKLEVKFDTIPFDWDNMLERYDSYSSVQAIAVARLMYAVGVACDMQYDSLPVGSASWTDDMALGLTSYFDYTYDSLISQYASAAAYRADKQAAPVVEIKYNIQDLSPAFNASLDKGCPILMGGADANSGAGHEFVCDGRDGNGLFHINWGWGGKNNNYCTLDALTPAGSSYVFSCGVDAIVGLVPMHLPTRLEPVVEYKKEIKKIIINNQLYILRDGKCYNAQGQLIQQ